MHKACQYPVFGPKTSRIPLQNAFLTCLRLLRRTCLRTRCDDKWYQNDIGKRNLGTQVWHGRKLGAMCLQAQADVRLSDRDGQRDQSYNPKIS